jgi:hypothetical protein
MPHAEKRVVIVGCGGIGSWLAEALARTLEFQAPGSAMILVDGDNYEEKNVERQSFDQIGNKAKVLRERVQKAVPNTFVVAKPAWVVPEDAVDDLDPEEAAVGKITAGELMDEGDYVFAVVDNFAARKLILDSARLYDDIDVFIGGNGSPETGDPLYGTVVHYRRRNAQDITVHPSVMHEEFANPPDKNPGELSCAERAKLDGGTQLITANLQVMTLMMAKVSQVMFGTPEQENQAMACSELAFDLSIPAIVEYDRRTEHAISLEKDNQYASA